MKTKIRKPASASEADHIHVLTFHQRRFVVGLTWQTIRAQRNPMKEIRRVGKEQGLDLVAVRQSDSIQAGFAPKTRLRLRGAYSLSVALASLLEGCCIAVVALGKDSQGNAQFTMMGKTERGGIHPFSDRIYSEVDLQQYIIDLKDQLRGSKGNMEIPVHGDPAFSWVTTPLDLGVLLAPSNLSKNFKLRPLTWGMTRGQLVATGVAVVLAIIALMVYLHFENEREAAARQASLKEIARQAELNRQARYKAALEGLRHPWTDQPSVTTFISHCREGLDRVPISIKGWISTVVVCTPSDISVQSVRRTNSATTTAQYVQAVKTLFGVTAVFNFQNSSLTSFSLPQTLSPEGDDPMVPVGERLMNFISLFQALNIDLSVSAVPIKKAEKNKQGEEMPQQDWLTYTFSAETDIPPQQIFTGNSYTGIRLSSITLAVNSADGSLRYKISGSLYGKP
ncbi:type 4b pilus protein PilO2 [Rahnella sikkimica]|uniref:Conjugal transfer protein n=1 Tax=Rahnella sikkimica TaxID=1805933 RepID=A0A2L1UZC6_9GAMM|nr:type 4b pilus protein PilO2 [Rahnella sikkimica]AVF38198.1 conjugal transfer protein [Rahnella sikkimica]